MPVPSVHPCMGTAQADPPLEVSNTKVFDYQREVIVELHGRTTSGEFEVVSYAFRQDPGGEAGLQPRATEIASAHEELVQEALAEADHTIA